jgi:hypothetical protein
MRMAEGVLHWSIYYSQMKDNKKMDDKKINFQTHSQTQIERFRTPMG